MDIRRMEFEKTNGNLQEEYQTWRMEMEKQREENGAWCFPDAGFAEARERFAEYCRLPEPIPFDVMLWYESNYEKN